MEPLIQARARISWSPAISTLRHDHSGRIYGPRPSLLTTLVRAIIWPSAISTHDMSIPGEYLAHTHLYITTRSFRTNIWPTPISKLRHDHSGRISGPRPSLHYDTIIQDEYLVPVHLYITTRSFRTNSWFPSISALRHDHSGRISGPRPSLLNLYSRHKL